TGEASRRTGMTGSGVRISQKTSAARQPTANASTAYSRQSVQPKRLPAEESANSSDSMPTPNRSVPGTSARKRAPASGGQYGMRSASTAASTPSGRLMKNTARQLKCSVSNAPSNGPRVLEAANTPAK